MIAAGSVPSLRSVVLGLAFLLISFQPLAASDTKTFGSDPYSSPRKEPKQDLKSTSIENAPTNRVVPTVSPSPSPSKPAKLEMPLTGPEATLPPFNQWVIREIRKMPEAGGYAATSHAMQQLRESITQDEIGSLSLHPKLAQPSFCSSATYLVFLSAISELQKSKKIPSDKKLNQQLLVHGQADGEGVWGRWNANGPGTAVLVKELGIGENFVNLEHAQSGDFLKIWWSEEIGAKEHGHSVVFLNAGTNKAGDPVLTFWSSNIPGGYGVKEIPKTKAKRLLFSRITKPENIQNVAKLIPKSEFLASMTSKSVTMDNVKKEAGMDSHAAASKDESLR
jgi:hypothetical protein